MRIEESFVRWSLDQEGLPCSESAVKLLLMIAAHESGMFYWVRQMSGPALGLWQMEPVGYREVCRYVNLREERFSPSLVEKVRQREFEWLGLDQVYACQCARVFLMAEPMVLPDEGDHEGLACYAKMYWNTESGSAVVEDYLGAYERFCGQ